MPTDQPKFEQITNLRHAVYLPGAGGKRWKHVGDIRGRIEPGATPGSRITKWQYVPLGKKRGGELFATLEACKADVAGTDETTLTAQPDPWGFAMAGRLTMVVRFNGQIVGKIKHHRATYRYWKRVRALPAPVYITASNAYHDLEELQADIRAGKLGQP